MKRNTRCLLLTACHRVGSIGCVPAGAPLVVCPVGAFLCIPSMNTAEPTAARGELLEALPAINQLTAAELAARGAFYEALAAVQQQLTPDSTLRDALRILPVHGLAWWIDTDNIYLGHVGGWQVSASTATAVPYGDELEWLIGLPSIVVPPDRDGTVPAQGDAAPAPVEDQGAETALAASPATAPAPAAPLDQPPAPPASVAPAPPAPAQAPAPAPAPPPPAVEPAAEQLAAAEEEPDPSHSTEPISAEEAYYCRGMIGKLDEATRKAFKTAFCKAFSISPPPLRVAGLITERRHLEFVIRFVNEAEGFAQP